MFIYLIFFNLFSLELTPKISVESSDVHISSKLDRIVDGGKLKELLDDRLYDNPLNSILQGYRKISFSESGDLLAEIQSSDKSVLTNISAFNKEICNIDSTQVESYRVSRKSESVLLELINGNQKFISSKWLSPLEIDSSNKIIAFSDEYIWNLNSSHQYLNCILCLRILDSASTKEDRSQQIYCSLDSERSVCLVGKFYLPKSISNFIYVSPDENCQKIICLVDNNLERQKSVFSLEADCRDLEQLNFCNLTEIYNKDDISFLKKVKFSGNGLAIASLFDKGLNKSLVTVNYLAQDRFIRYETLDHEIVDIFPNTCGSEILLQCCSLDIAQKISFINKIRPKK